jgi:RsiW-degrading membrane proteinase PrsW (M82 family)
MKNKSPTTAIFIRAALFSFCIGAACSPILLLSTASWDELIAALTKGRYLTAVFFLFIAAFIPTSISLMIQANFPKKYKACELLISTSAVMFFMLLALFPIFWLVSNSAPPFGVLFSPFVLFFVFAFGAFLQFFNDKST